MYPDSRTIEYDYFMSFCPLKFEGLGLNGRDLKKKKIAACGQINRRSGFHAHAAEPKVRDSENQTPTDAKLGEGH